MSFPLRASPWGLLHPQPVHQHVPVGASPWTGVTQALEMLQGGCRFLLPRRAQISRDARLTSTYRSVEVNVAMSTEEKFREIRKETCLLPWPRGVGLLSISAPFRDFSLFLETASAPPSWEQAPESFLPAWWPLILGQGSPPRPVILPGSLGDVELS